MRLVIYFKTSTNLCKANNVYTVLVRDIASVRHNGKLNSSPLDYVVLKLLYNKKILLFNFLQKKLKRHLNYRIVLKFLSNTSLNIISYSKLKKFHTLSYFNI